MRAPAKWIVGIDVRRRSDGAVAFAAWLHAQLRDQLIGVHVAAREMFTAMDQLAGPAVSDVRLRVELERSLVEAGLGDAFARVEVIEALDPVGPLEERCREEGACGLIIGRIAGQSTYETVRLGAVARRLLRGLVAPIWVVPPDLRAETIGDGTILVAVTPEEASVGAVRVAWRLAAGLGRKIMFVRVVNELIERSSLFPARETVEREQTDQQREAEAHTRGWLMDLEVEGPLDVRRGGTLEEILVAARRHSAAFVVCGSRKLGMLGRIFSGSLSSELSAHSSVPVLVVPPDAR
jgi:nucleotide-binding universal stress UspA family protein